MAVADRVRHRALLPLLLLVAVAVPAPALAVLDGIPFTGAAEALCLLVVAAAVVVRPPSSRWTRAALVLGLGGLLLKLALLLVPGQGFTSCYVILVGDRDLTCERSYDSPWQRDATRQDPVIDFGKRVRTGEPPFGMSDSNWHLGAVNSLEFNFYRPGQPDRERLPLRVSWRGTVQSPPGGELRLHYVGEGWLEVASTRHELPASYDAPASVAVPARAGPVAVEYAWTPPDAATGPYAMARLLDAGGAPVPPADPRDPADVVAAAADALLLLCAAGAAVAVALALGIGRSRAALLGVTAVPVGCALVLAALRASAGLSPGTLLALLVPLIVALCVGRIWTTRTQAAVAAGASGCLLAAALLYVTVGTLDPRSVTYRSGGNDFLTHESFARSLLEEASLRGGEDVFEYSPGFRYTLFAQHLVFGDGDAPISLLSVLALVCGAWFAVETLVLRRLSAGPLRHVLAPRALLRWPLLAAVAAVLILTALLSSAEVAKGGFLLLSEYPTWVLMLFGIPLLLTARRLPAASLGATLLAVAFAHRANHGLGLAVVVLVGASALVWRQPTWRRRAAAASLVLGPGLLIALLPAAHNLLYGGRLVLLAQTPRLAVNFPLSPGDLLDVDEPRVQSVLQNQLAGVLATPGAAADLSMTFRLSVHAVQLGLALVLIVVLARRLRHLRGQLLLLLVPVGYLVPHVFIQVYVYYPRHIVAGYLAGALVLLCMAGTALVRAVAAGVEQPDADTTLAGGQPRAVSSGSRVPPFWMAQPTR